MKILLATDGSPEAEAALTFGAQIARRGSVSTTILAIADTELPIESGQIHGSPTDSPQISSRAESVLARALKLVGVPGIQIQSRPGNPYEQILYDAYSGAYDLIIMGDSHPRNLLERLRRGSTSVRVAENAPCSVIIVRGAVGPVHRILICDSGAGRSSLFSQMVLQLAELLEGDEEVTILHVMSQIGAWPGVRGAQLRAGAIELIAEHTPEGEIFEQDVQLLEKPGIHPSAKVRHGLVVDEILAEAHIGDYDLVVLGEHPAVGKQRFMLDNIAHQIIKDITRPVLVVRAKRGN
jgi:nucleotide-binding universal stress UspA family protein